MGEFCFENQGINTYLVYTFDDKDVIDTMSLGMLTNNEISGLAKVLFQQMDTVKLIKYNVSSKISLEQFLSGTVNKKRVVGILLGIVNGMLTIEDYMIDLDFQRLVHCFHVVVVFHELSSLFFGEELCSSYF